MPGRVGRYGFAHALIRAAVYDHLSALRRARLHGRVGEALERLHADDIGPHVAQIAHHFGEAAAVERPDRAVAYALQAGRRAEELLAYEEATEHFASALRALDQAGAEDDRRRCELLLALGSAQRRAGDDVADETFVAALDAARSVGDGRLLADAALGYAGPWSQIGTVRQDRVVLLEEALDALAPDELALRARLLARLTLEFYYAGTPERRLQVSAEALAIARKLDDRSVLAAALDARHYALWRPENAEERLAVAHEAAAVAESDGDRERLLESLGWSVVDYLELGDVVAVDRQIERAADIADAAHLPLYLWWTTLFRGMRAQLDGAFDEAERLALEALALGQRGQADNAVNAFAIQMYNIRREQARLEEVLEPVRSFAASYPAVPAWRALVAHAQVELGRTAAARDAFDAIAAPGFGALPRDANWLIAVTLLAEVAAALRDGDRAAELYKELEPYAGSVVVVGRAATCNGAAARLLGVLAGTSGRWGLAERHFDHALELHNRMGARPLVARTQLAYAEMLQSRSLASDADRARALLAGALEITEPLGMVAVGRRAAQVLAELGEAPRSAANGAARGGAVRPRA